MNNSETWDAVATRWWAHELRWLKGNGMKPIDLAKLCDDMVIGNESITWSVQQADWGAGCKHNPGYFEPLAFNIH